MIARTARDLLEPFVAEVRRLAPQARLLLFGSQARGQATAGSDFDMLIVLPQPADANLQAALEALSARLLLEEGLLVSVFILAERELERLRFEPFVQNALREGVAI